MYEKLSGGIKARWAEKGGTMNARLSGLPSGAYPCEWMAARRAARVSTVGIKSASRLMTHWVAANADAALRRAWQKQIAVTCAAFERGELGADAR